METNRLERLSACEHERPEGTVSLRLYQLQLRTASKAFLSAFARCASIVSGVLLAKKRRYGPRLTVAGLENAARSAILGFLLNPQDLGSEQDSRAMHREQQPHHGSFEDKFLVSISLFSSSLVTPDITTSTRTAVLLNLLHQFSPLRRFAGCNSPNVGECEMCSYGASDAKTRVLAAHVSLRAYEQRRSFRVC